MHRRYPPQLIGDREHMLGRRQLSVTLSASEAYQRSSGRSSLATVVEPLPKYCA